MITPRHIRRTAVALCLSLRRRAALRRRPAPEAVRAAVRPGRQGRRLGADAAGARRQDARHGEGHAAGLRDGPRAPATAAPSSRRPSAAPRDGRRIQPRHGGALEEERCRRRASPIKAHVREGGPVRDRFLEGDGHHDVPAAPDQREAAAEDPRPEARHAHRLELLHDGATGRRTRPRPSPRTAPAGARRCCGSCRRRSKARGRSPRATSC